jgi:hypothetical protein
MRDGHAGPSDLSMTRPSGIRLRIVVMSAVGWSLLYLYSVCPVSRLPALMSNGNDNNCVPIYSVDQGIGKANKKKSADLGFDLSCNERISSNEPDSAIKFVEEGAAKTSACYSYHSTASDTS